MENFMVFIKKIKLNKARGGSDDGYAVFASILAVKAC